MIHDLFNGCFICYLYCLIYLTIVERTAVPPISMQAAFIHVIPWLIPNIFCGYNIDKNTLSCKDKRDEMVVILIRKGK